jgi:hypothetical protein
MIMRGLYIGDDMETFTLGARLSQRVNLDLLDKPLQKVLVYLDPQEFKSTWLGNKAIYRTRMAMADGGELIILAPGLKEFGEDAEIDRLEGQVIEELKTTKYRAQYAQDQIDIKEKKYLKFYSS